MLQRNRRYAIVSAIILVVALALVASQGLALFGEQTGGPAPTAATLRLAWSEPETLDPALAQDAGSWAYLLHLHSGLVRLGPDLAVVPELAQWQVSGDGRTYTFTLREDARFQDGRPVTAADVKYSLERAADPALKSPVAEIYLGDIVGVKEKLAGHAQEIAGVVVLDERTVAITIDAPKVYFLAKLTYPTAAVLDRRNVESSADWSKRANGAGPYRLARWEGDWIVLERSEQYFRPGPAPREVRFYIGPGSTMAMYEGDELDLVQVGLGDIERALDEQSALNHELVVSPSLGLYYLELNTKQEPFTERAVRRAFAMALDKDKVVEVTLKGTVRKASGILPPGLLGHDPTFAGLPYDVEQARRSLAESTYGGAAALPPITITGGMGDLFAQVYYRNLGAEMEVEVVREGYFEGLAEGAFQMRFAGWMADYPDPENFLDVLLHSQSRGNHGGYANAAVDRLLEQARLEADTERRAALYREVERIAVADAAIIPLFFNVDYHLVKPWVRGLNLTPLGLISFEGVTVE